MREVKTSRRRAYDSTGRQQKARRSRRAVLDAARELVEQQGYTATTIAEVARVAGVSAESVYKAFRTKAALVKEVWDVTIAGDDDPVPVAERPEARQLRDEPDVAVKLRLYARSAAPRAQRSARLQLALRDAASTDPGIAQLWRQLQSERLTGMTMLAHHLVGTGQLPAHVGADHVRDVLWTCISIEVYDLFVLQRGWTLVAYTRWLEQTLTATITVA